MIRRHARFIFSPTPGRLGSSGPKNWGAGLVTCTRTFQG